LEILAALGADRSRVAKRLGISPAKDWSGVQPAIQKTPAEFLLDSADPWNRWETPLQSLDDPRGARFESFRGFNLWHDVRIRFLIRSESDGDEATRREAPGDKRGEAIQAGNPRSDLGEGRNPRRGPGPG
jgi:hypothetical protein